MITAGFPNSQVEFYKMSKFTVVEIGIGLNIWVVFKNATVLQYNCQDMFIF